MKPAVEMFCADCDTELLVPHQIGKKNKDRKVVCSKCVKKYKKEA